MTDQLLMTQAALIYGAAPDLDFAALRAALNHALASSGSPALEDSPMSSDQFALFRNARVHVSIALHRTPLPARGLQHALAAAATRSKRCDFERILDQSHAHVIVSVGDGPTPLPLEPVTAAPAAIKLALLHKAITLIHDRAPADALHMCTNDLFHSAAEIEGAAAQAIAPALVMHPLAADEPSRAIRLCNSEHLIGSVLEIHEIPNRVPVSMQLTLANTLVTQHMSGALPLDDGDRLEDAVGMGLTVHRARPTAQAPSGRIVVTFDSEAPQRAPRWDSAAFHPHRGYSVLSSAIAPAAETDEWTPDSASGYGARIAASAENRSSNWMIWVGIGLFLWIGLPLLDIPQKIIHATFSDQLVGPGIGETGNNRP